MRKVSCFTVFCIVALEVTSSGEKHVKGTNGMEYETYQQAVRNQDFEAADIFLDRIENDEGKDNEKYITARDFIVGHELTYLASVNSEESTKRIIYLLTEMRPESKKIPIGNFGVGTVDNCQYNELKKQIDTYSLDVSNFNKQCHRILNLAITELNKELAQDVLKCYIPTIIVESHTKEAFVSDDLIYTINYTDDDYVQASQKVKDVNWNFIDKR